MARAQTAARARSAACRTDRDHARTSSDRRKDVCPFSSLPLPRVVVVRRAVFEIAQGGEPLGGAFLMKCFGLGACLGAGDLQHRFCFVAIATDANRVRRSGALDPEGPGRGSGISRHPLRTAALVERGQPEAFAFGMQPDRLAGDRDEPFLAVDRAIALHTSAVGRGVVGLVCGPAVRSAFDGIRPIFFLPARKPLFKPGTPGTSNDFQRVGSVLNPEQKGLVPGLILAKSPLFSTLFRVFRVQRPDSGPQKNRTPFRPRFGAGDSA